MRRSARSAQHIVLRDDGVLQAIAQGTFRLAGRVGFLSLPGSSRSRAPGDDLEGRDGVLGRLDRLVQPAPDMQPLVEQLLGRVWAVEMLRARAAAAGRTAIDGVCLVTLAGEVVHSDGTVVAGPKDVGGLISRRTELRDLRREEAVLREQVDEGEQEIVRLHENIDQQQAALRQLTDRHKVVQSGTGAINRSSARTLARQLVQLDEEVQSDRRRSRTPPNSSWTAWRSGVARRERQLDRAREAGWPTWKRPCRQGAGSHRRG